MNQFTYVLNAGRSGSTYLYSLINNNYSDDVHCLHEGITSQASLPRIFNRAYTDDLYGEAIQSAPIRQYLEKIDTLLETRDVIETGWTAFHLLPIFSRWFGNRFSYCILHRDPTSVALSRAVLGCYHPRSWYDQKSEVSPFDNNSICTSKAGQWSEMNYVERSFYFWFVVCLEADEFSSRCFPPQFEFSSVDLFDPLKHRDVLEKLGLSGEKTPIIEADKNPISSWALETFAVGSEWQRIFEHQDILDYAKIRFGYDITMDLVSSRIEKYQVPHEIAPMARYYTQYWRWRRYAGQILKNLGKKNRH